MGTETKRRTSDFSPRKTTITSLVSKVLNPIVEILLEIGFSFRDFNELAKLEYVKAASKKYGIKGRPTNMSRVAIMTGLTRREVARLRKVMDSNLDVRSPGTVAGRVLSDWHNKPDYLDKRKEPKRLPIEGRGSLINMIDQVRGDIPSSAIVKELERVGAICIKDRTARVQSRHYSPSKLAAHVLTDKYAEVLCDLGRTLDLEISVKYGVSTCQSHQALHKQANTDVQVAFNRFVSSRVKVLARELDEWLAKHNSSDETEGKQMEVGLCRFHNDK